MTGAAQLDTRLKGVKVLVVEDEFYLAMDMKDGIEAAGGEVIGPCADLANTLSLIDRSMPDYGLIDINLGEGPSFEIAAELRQRSIPFAFLTGYDAASIPADLVDIQRFEKPADMRRIVNTVGRAVGK